MKSSKAEILSRTHSIPDLRFDADENESLTSYSGLIVYQALFEKLGLKDGLRKCFSHLNVTPIFQPHLIMLLLIVHLTLGFRQLRERDFYANDPLVRRLLGWRRIPDVSTICRSMAASDAKCVDSVRSLNRELVLNRLVTEALARITLDFDGSVLSTSRHAEGTAVGYNKQKKGARSYYPLFCTVSQTGQILDLHHRAGNIHDSNGAEAFVIECVKMARGKIPGALIESRFDSAFFQEDLITRIDGEGIEFTVSVPFERFAELKAIIENRKRWISLDDTWSFFECEWKPKVWNERFRFVFVRQRVKVKRKGPLQLDLFEPREYEYDYKVFVTNKTCGAKKALMFHNGRGAQEGVFAEAKDEAQLDYIPVRSLCGNQLFCLASVLTHNLSRELQLQVLDRSRGTTEKRSPHWVFRTLDTLRRTIIMRAGRLIRPNNRLTLVMGANTAAQADLQQILAALGNAA